MYFLVVWAQVEACPVLEVAAWMRFPISRCESNSSKDWMPGASWCQGFQVAKVGWLQQQNRDSWSPNIRTVPIPMESSLANKKYKLAGKRKISNTLGWTSRDWNLMSDKCWSFSSTKGRFSWLSLRFKLAKQGHKINQLAVYGPRLALIWSIRQEQNPISPAFLFGSRSSHSKPRNMMLVMGLTTLLPSVL